MQGLRGYHLCLGMLRMTDEEKRAKLTSEQREYLSITERRINRLQMQIERIQVDLDKHLRHLKELKEEYGI